MLMDIGVIVYIDSCGFYPPNKEEKKAINKILELGEQGILGVEITESVREELLDSKTPKKIKEYLKNRMVSCEMQNTTADHGLKDKIRKVLFGNKK